MSNSPQYRLVLFISGASPNSVRALNNLKQICEIHLKGNYKLEVVDVYQQPELAKQEQIIALPTLIRKNPTPTRHLIGDMSDRARVLRGLGINPSDIAI
jgi:circadian clock protein KaiB